MLSTGIMLGSNFRKKQLPYLEHWNSGDANRYTEQVDLKRIFILMFIGPCIIVILEE